MVLVGRDDVKDGQTGDSPRMVSGSRGKTREEGGGCYRHSLNQSRELGLNRGEWRIRVGETGT